MNKVEVNMDLPIPEWMNTENIELEVVQEEAMLEATEELYKALIEADITKTELAEKLGKKPAFVSKLFRGSHNMTLKTLAEVAYRLDKRVKLGLVDNEKKWTPNTVDGEYTLTKVFSASPAYRKAANDHKEFAEGWSL